MWGDLCGVVRLPGARGELTLRCVPPYVAIASGDDDSAGNEERRFPEGKP